MNGISSSSYLCWGLKQNRRKPAGESWWAALRKGPRVGSIQQPGARSLAACAAHGEKDISESARKPVCCPLFSQGPMSSGSKRLAGATSRLLWCDFFTIALTYLSLLYRNYDS